MYSISRFFIFIIIISYFTITTAQINSALNKPVIRSFSPNNDNNFSTVTTDPSIGPSIGWQSARFLDIPDHTLFPEFLQIDLLDNYNLSSIAFLPPSYSSSSSSSYPTWPIAFTVSVSSLGEIPTTVVNITPSNAIFPDNTGNPVIYPFTSATSTCGRFVTISISQTNGTSSSIPLVAGGSFVQGQGDTAIYWVYTNGTIKYHATVCTPCATVNACSNFTVVPMNYINNLTNGSNFTCSMLPSIQGPMSYPVQMGRIAVYANTTSTDAMCTVPAPDWPPSSPLSPASTPPGPISLSVEKMTNPLAISTNIPMFNWTLVPSTIYPWPRGIYATSFHIMMSTTDTFSSNIIWDETVQVPLPPSVYPYLSFTPSFPNGFGIRYNGTIPLLPTQRFYWKVMMTLNYYNTTTNTTETLTTDWSNANDSSSMFGIGLLSFNDWKVAGAEWIGTGLPNATHAAVYMRNDIIIPSPTASIDYATLFISGLGYFQAFIDGTRVGEYELTPGWTQYNMETHYIAYDITDLVNQKEHAISIILGDGWYALSEDPWVHHLERAVYVSVPKLLLYGYIQYTDGTNFTFVSSSTTNWTWAKDGGDITRCWVPAEDIDANKALPSAWMLPGYTSTSFIPVASVSAPTTNSLVSPRELPTIKMELHSPQMMYKTIQYNSNTQLNETVYVYNFGREIQGWININAITGSNTVNTTLSILLCGSMYGYCTESSTNVDTGGPHVSYWILSSSLPPSTVQTYEPHFMYVAIQTAVIRVINGSLANDLTLADVSARHVAFALTRTGSMALSDPLHSYLHESLLRTAEHYGASGCPNDPTREFKCWTQDIETFAEPMLYTYNSQSSTLYFQWLVDMMDTCSNTTKECPEVSPGPVLDDGYNGAYWGGMIVWGPWQLYYFQGDIDILTTFYPSMKGYVQWLNNTAFPNNYDVEVGLGDWVSTIAECRTNSSWINTPALFYYSRIVAATANLLGYTADASAFTALSEIVQTNYNNRYLNRTTGVYAAGYQCNQVQPLWYQMAPTPAVATLVTEALINQFVMNDNSLITSGFVTQNTWVKTLGDLVTGNGHAAINFQQDGVPSMYSLSAGTDHDLFKEEWDGSGAEMPSLGGSLGLWSYRILCGLRPHAADEGLTHLSSISSSSPINGMEIVPGWGHFLYNPAAPINNVLMNSSIMNNNTSISQLHYASCNVTTPRGEVIASWRRYNNTASSIIQSYIELLVPSGTTATVFLPANSINQITENGIIPNTPASQAIGVTYLPSLSNEQTNVIALGLVSGHYWFIM